MTDRRLSEEEARALWERAARLHAESAARELSAGDSEDEVEPRGPRDGSDYSVDVVVRSAVDAGIPAEYVRQALEEMGTDAEAPGTVDRWADRFLGEGERVLRVSRVIDSPVQEVYEAMQRVYPNAPYGLTLIGTDGKNPLRGGRLTFEVPYHIGLGQSGGASSKAITDIRHWADIKELHMRLVPVPPATEGEPERTEFHLMAPLANSRRVNFWAGNAVSGLVGFVGALLTGAVTGSIIDPVVGAEVLMTFGVAGAGGIGTFLGLGRAWRPIYRASLRKGKAGMEKLIDALIVDLQTGGAFTSKDPPKAIGDGGVDDLLGSLGL